MTAGFSNAGQDSDNQDSGYQDRDYGDLNAQFRTFYFNRDKEPDPDSEAFTQGLMLRYSSPYYRDVTGLNASWFGNLKLVGEDGKGGTGLLHDQEDGSQESYRKLAEIFVKFKLPYAGGLDIGRIELDTPLLNNPDFRATPSTTQAGVLRLGTEKTGFYGLVSDKGSAQTDTDFGSYTDSNGDNFNIYVVGIQHNADNLLTLHASVGQADNVMQQIYFNAGYPWRINNKFSLLLDGYQYYGRADGEGALVGVGPDYSSSLTNIATRLSGKNVKWTLSYQKVHGDDYQISWDGFVHNDNTYQNWQSVQRLNFELGGEESWQIRVDYDFKDNIEGFSAMARYISGDNIKREDGRNGSEWERDIDFIYSPPGIDNLSLRWRYAVVRSSETFDSDEHRFIINYTIENNL